MFQKLIARLFYRHEKERHFTGCCKSCPYGWIATAKGAPCIDCIGTSKTNRNYYNTKRFRR
jgi:hypothetical protein